MSAEQNKAVVRRWLAEVWGKGNLAVVDELAGSGFVWHWSSPAFGSDREGYKQFLAMDFDAFDDVSCSTEDVVAEGDRVASRWTWRGTHKKEYMGAAPTGKQVALTGICVNRFADGKIVEEWCEMDMMGMMQQLGAASPPA